MLKHLFGAPAALAVTGWHEGNLQLFASCERRNLTKPLLWFCRRCRCGSRCMSSRTARGRESPRRRLPPMPCGASSPPWWPKVPAGRHLWAVAAAVGERSACMHHHHMAAIESMLCSLTLLAKPNPKKCTDVCITAARRSIDRHAYEELNELFDDCSPTCQRHYQSSCTEHRSQNATPGCADEARNSPQKNIPWFASKDSMRGACRSISRGPNSSCRSH